MILEKPSFKRGLNISLSGGFDFDLMKPHEGTFSRKVDFSEGVEVCTLRDLKNEDFNFSGEDYFSRFNHDNASEVLALAR